VQQENKTITANSYTILNISTCVDEKIKKSPHSKTRRFHQTMYFQKKMIKQFILY